MATARNDEPLQERTDVNNRSHHATLGGMAGTHGGRGPYAAGHGFADADGIGSGLGGPDRRDLCHGSDDDKMGDEHMAEGPTACSLGAGLHAHSSSQ